MKIGYMSDYHVDMGNKFIDCGSMFDQYVDVLIIAGDIGNREQTVSFIDSLIDTMIGTKIILVLGNHDFYNHVGMTINDHIKFYKDQFKDDPVDVLVHGEVVSYYDVNFVGATLWSDLADRYDPMSGMQAGIAAMNSISDFEYIHDLDVNTMRLEYIKDRNGIIDSLSSLDMDNTIVVTHFSPSIDCRNDAYPITPLSYYFCGHMDDVIKNFQPKYWIYGHTHGNNDDVIMVNTIMTTNQCQGFGNSNKLKIIEM